MNALIKFKEQLKYNKKNQVFAPFDDADLGLRRPGYFEKNFTENGHQCQSYVFDNGEHFIFDEVEESLHYLDPLPLNFFLHKYIERAVYDFIRNHELKDDNGELLKIHCAPNNIEVDTLIHLLPNEGEKTVYLTNISLPDRLRHKRLGLKLISYVYLISASLGYRLVITDMTQDFYLRMIRREAQSLDIDAVEITAQTILKGKVKL